MSSGTNGARAILGAGDGDGVCRRRRWRSGEDGVQRRMSLPTARVSLRIPVVDGAKEDSRAPAETAVELLPLLLLAVLRLRWCPTVGLVPLWRRRHR